MSNLYLTSIRLMFRSDLHGVRFLLFLAEVIWAIALLWPGDTFSRPTYAGMSMVMSELAWALVFMLTAAGQAAILLSGRYSDRFARVFAAFNAGLWSFVTLSMYLSVYPPPAAISGEMALACGALWVFFRTGDE